MVSLSDRVGVSESTQGSKPNAFPTDVNSAASFVAPTTLSLMSRLAGRLRTWRQREHERAELARMSQAELHDIGMSSSEHWAEISTPFWR